jgi:hypothetical protein
MLFNETLFYYTRTCGSRFFFALSLIYLLPASLVAAAEHYSLLSSQRLRNPKGDENGTGVI